MFGAVLKMHELFDAKAVIENDRVVRFQKDSHFLQCDGGNRVIQYSFCDAAVSLKVITGDKPKISFKT